MGGEEVLGVTTGQPNLYKQDLSKLDVNKLTALSREVISRQATINIGTIGHVAHGKSTIVKAISGVQTVRFKNELERNITIKLETRAMGGSGENAEVSSSTYEIPSAREKRSISPGSIQPSTKQPRLDNKLSPWQEDNKCLINFINRTKFLNNKDNSVNLFFCENSVGKETRKDDSVFINNFENSKILDDFQQIEKDSVCKNCVEKATRKDDSVLINNFENSEILDNFQKIEQDSICSTNKKINFLETNDRLMSNMKFNLHDLKLKDLRIEVEDISISIKNFHKSKSSVRNKLYEVERILGKNHKEGVVLYLIKWKGWDAGSNTWEPLDNLINCSELLEEFESERTYLIEKFKRKTNFYPNARDVEQFMKYLIRTGLTVECVFPDADALYKNIKRFFKQKFTGSRELGRKIEQGILRTLLYDFRREQFELLQEWENEMNNMSKGRPLIRVENLVDLEGPPQNFFYVDDYIPGLGVTIPEEPPIGCECITCDAKSDCCFSQSGGTFAYTSTCKIRVPPGTPIYECNKRCTCTSDCQNRVVQRGTTAKLCIFKTSNGRGWGVKTLRVIKKGTFVTQYVGEVIMNDEAEKRGKEYDAAGRTYLFDLDYNETEGPCLYTVDAAIYGNISHFINHSCDPNLAVYGVWIDCLDPNLPKLALFATRDIKQNEEITFDYMYQPSKTHDIENGENFVSIKSRFNNGITSQLHQKLEFIAEEVNGRSIRNKIKCKCGTKICRQYLF